ncbi:MAG: amino acid racemase [Phycisphaerales bacterium]|nr:amino acid racemase [Phycisphaerales bacterium]
MTRIRGNTHIGIVAVSPEGAALCYQQLFRHASIALEPDRHPTVSIHNIPLSRYVEAVRRDDWRAVGGFLSESAVKLASMGAEFCFTPDNAVQHAVHLAEVSSPIPWLKMTEAVAHEIARDNRTTVGVIGTHYVTTGSAYQTDLGIKGIKLVRPSDDDAELLDRIIFDELVFGVISESSRAAMIRIIEDFRDRGCEGVILGSSEAPLLVTPDRSPLPVYDASNIMAKRAIDYAIAGPAVERSQRFG